MGYSPWGCKESDMTEATEHAYTHVVIFLKPHYCLGFPGPT